MPIGAVVVLNGKVIGKGYNLRTKLQMATAHAEMRAIDRACKKEHSWRLPEAELYVTLEPCPMCMGAILNARIKRVWFGAYEQKGRSLTSELANANLLNHTVEVTGGVLEKDCSEVLTSFFQEMRAREKLKKMKQKAKSGTKPPVSPKKNKTLQNRLTFSWKGGRINVAGPS